MKRFIMFAALLAAPILASLAGCSLDIDRGHDTAYYGHYPQYYGYSPRYREPVYVAPRHDDHVVVQERF